MENKENKFSIIIPVYNGEETIGRAINSIITQTYDNWELIIVNDGSTDNTQKIVSSYMKRDFRIRMFVLPENYGRMAARNIGMKMARNEWLCFLDADDEFMSNYLEVVNNEINRNPNYNIFNFGMLIKEREIDNEKRYENGWKIIEPLKLKEIDNGMESFSSGKIGIGSFIFKKKLLDEFGFYPETKIPYGGENSFPALLVKKNEIFKEICKQNENGQWLPLGNPNGDDYALFWGLTRKNKSKMLNVVLYIQHRRK